MDLSISIFDSVTASTVSNLAFAVFVSDNIVTDSGPEDYDTRWRFDEGSGTTATDDAGHANGTLNNAPAWTSTTRAPTTFQNNCALTFTEASSTYVRTTRRVADDFSLCFWMKSSQVPPTTDVTYLGRGIMWADTSGSNNDFALGITTSGSSVHRISFALGNPDEHFHGTVEVCDNVWHHVAVTRARTSGRITIYIDGVLDTTGTATNRNSLTASSNIDIGGNVLDGRYFEGRLDDVRCYTRVLGAAEVKSLGFFQNLSYTVFSVSVNVSVADNILAAESVSARPFIPTGTRYFLI